MIQIAEAHHEMQLPDVRALFAEYAASLDIDLSFQGFEEELATLPGPYAPPEGALLIGFWHGRIAGCVALRKISAGICEMKRLYTKPEFRGLHIGRALAEAAIRQARVIGYNRMRLDTLASMERARTMYRSLGFHEIAPYCYNPYEDAVFMELTWE